MNGPAVVYRSPAGRWVLLATVLGSAMASIDATVVGIALPSIGRQFHAPLASLQWVVTGYLLTLAALLLVGGTLGDEFGRRRVFMVGVAWFALASTACAVAPDTTVLVATRLLQGVGAALLVPGSLAIIEASFAPEDRSRAIGAWSGLSGVATAAGPLLGGYLVSAASWRWIFLINLPIGISVLLVAHRHVPESRRVRQVSTLDLPGALLTVVGLAGITYGLIEGPTQGWSTVPVLAMTSAGVTALGALAWVEVRAPNPLIPRGLFRQRQFTVTNALTLLVYAALSGTLFLLPVELQVVDRYSALQTGVSLLPLTALMLALSSRSGRLAARIGPRLQMSVGPMVVGAGLALLARTAHGSSYPEVVLPAVVVFGLGLTATVAPLTATALGAVDADHAGLASAFNNDVARVGGLIAVAVLPALAGIAGGSYLHPASMGGGFRTAVFITAAWCGAGGALAALGIRNPRGAQSSARGSNESCLHCALDATPVTATDEA